MACCAHPDDAEILMGGTLAKYAERGDDVFIVITTNGEVGHPTLPKREIAAIRREEARRAADLIGAEMIWLGFPDEFLFDREETRLAIINAIRKCRPDVILTHWPGDLYNPDHTLTGQIVNDVAIMTTVPNIKTEEPPCDKIPVVYFADSVAGVGFLPEEYVDITSTIDVKRRMLAEHKSQVSDWLSDQYGVTMDEMMTISSQYRGFQAGVRYAEGFIRAKAWPRGVTGTLLP
ncbi:PIG-L deacetylase family protein [Paenibacillus spongiae]|uniref:PIG-L family deacetylase n=1 Tax=Paenibacillus spongiae TaxID=2909671 RepID=A0ABY5SJS2_9BACL|nr:PIG-L deacetylase family protein [Paenibacillus spongiae]UVI33680.1 PIG-L family deacetylase [Paenibacillus spongiae]